MGLQGFDVEMKLELKILHEAIFTKHFAWNDEREIRIVNLYRRDIGSTKTHKISRPDGVRKSGDSYKPYQEMFVRNPNVAPPMDFPPSKLEKAVLPIKSVVVGYSVPSAGMDYVKSLLDANGYPDVTVTRSDVPVRR